MAFEGYTSATSVLPGGSIDFHLDSDAAADFTVRIFRVANANPVMLSDGGHVVPQTSPAQPWENGADFDVAYSAQIGADWPSGIYRAQFDIGNASTNVRFVVRPAHPGSSSSILLQTSTTTEQAYNGWGGKSLYPSPGAPGADDRGRRVSFQRPAAYIYDYESRFILWMENNGLTAEVCTGLDLHAGRVPLDAYALLLSVGHDEYWSREMRDAVEGFVGAGGNVAFFSGNVCWWQIRIEDGERTMVCYKSALEDPLTGRDDARVTVNWYDVPVLRPENTLTGVSFRNGAGRWMGGTNGAYDASFPQHWVLDGTGLGLGDTFANGFVGYETDAALFDVVDQVAVVSGKDGTPVDFQVVAGADFGDWEEFGQPGLATMGVFQRVGTVFTVGCVDWAGSLWPQPDPICSRITLNVVRRLSALRPPNLWEQVGHAVDVRAMCGLAWWADFRLLSGRYLFAATGGGQLWRRPPLLRNVSWDAVGEANDVIALAGLDAHLYAITGDGQLWQRTAIPGEHWTQLAERPPAGRAMAATDSRLYVATADGTLLSGAVATPVTWEEVASAPDLVALTAIGGRLIGLTADERLTALPLANPAAGWEDIGAAPGMVALAAFDAHLFGADRDGRLWTRPPG